LRDKISNHQLFKFLGKIYHIMGNRKKTTNLSGILNGSLVKKVEPFPKIIVTPATSHPFSKSRTPDREESTPPLIATNTFFLKLLTKEINNVHSIRYDDYNEFIPVLFWLATGCTQQSCS
jgi:hypothetical protein